MTERAHSSIPRVDVLGVGVSAVTATSALAEIRRWVEEGEQHYVCVTGVHGVMESQEDPELLRIHNASGLTVPDGMPMVWAGRWAGLRSMERVAGPDLMPALCELAAAEGWTSYFYGGGPGVADRLATRLRARFPAFQVVGTHTPPFRPLTPEERHRIVAEINDLDPDLVWVGLSTPKQEYWMSEMEGVLRARALLGVGAAFDLHAGVTKRAPQWMQRSGLEWLYRLLSEPRRLAKRYLTNNPKFLWAIARRRPRPMSEV